MAELVDGAVANDADVGFRDTEGGGDAGGGLFVVEGHDDDGAFAEMKRHFTEKQIVELTVFCGALAGAGLGFLWFNAYPAEVFMGDVGALALGAALGAVGGVARVSSSGSPTALVRTGSTTFVAVSMVCTHQGTTVTISNGTYICTNHGARYSATGTWQGGQVTSSLPTFGATYDANAGTVAIARPS